MLAILTGDLCLLLGSLLLLLPLLATEISRSRDSWMGALFLFLGLVLSNNSDRLRGSPMLAVLVGGMLILNLGWEVLQVRWQQLSPEEQSSFGSFKRWKISLEQLLTSMKTLLRISRQASEVMPLKFSSTSPQKRWVRPESTKDENPEKESQTASIENAFQEIKLSDERLTELSGESSSKDS